MSNRIFLGLILALGALPASAFAQAAAESALTHAGSAASSASAGSRMGNTLNQSMNRLSQQVQRKIEQSPRNQSNQQMPSAPTNATASRVPGQPTPADSASNPAAGPLVLSIEGAAVPCPATPANGQAAQGKTGTESAHVNCHNGKSTSHDARLSPSVINLPSTK